MRGTCDPPSPGGPRSCGSLVLTLYCPGSSWSPFMAMHMRAAGLAPLGARRHGRSRPGPRTRPGASPRSTRDDEHPHAVGDVRPRSMRAASRRSLIREFVQLPTKTTSIGRPRIGSPGLRAMYSSAARRESRWDASATRSGSGTDEVIGKPIPGFVPHVTIGVELGGIEGDRAVECGAIVGRELAPARQRRFPSGAGRSVRAPVHVLERHVVRRDQPGARASLDAHVADRHAPLHPERADRRAAVLEDVTGPARDADPATGATG